MTGPKIRFENVCKRYGPLTVLDGLNLEVATGELVTIIGPSGSGKTTVLRVLMTLETIEEGLISIDGEPFNKMRSGGELVPASAAHIRRIRARIGMVFQNFNLFPHMTALGNCIEAPIYSLGLSKAEAIERLAGAGVVFENACTNFPVCALSRFSMMRDRLASAIEAWDNAAEFRVSIPPMAHYLRVEPRWSGQAARGARVMSGLPIAARSRREEVRS